MDAPLITAATKPPIVQGDAGSELLPLIVQADTPAPYLTQPRRDRATRNVPPVITKASRSTADGNASTKKPNLLAPIGSGLATPKIQQATAQSNVADDYRIARAFSPAAMPIVQGSSSRNSITPAIALPSPMESFSQAPSTLMPSPMSVIESGPMTLPRDSMIPAPPIVSGTLVSPSMQPPMMGAPMVSEPSYFDSAPGVPNGLEFPSVVGNPTSGGCADGNCESCGPGGCYNANQINCDYGTFGSVSSARRYGYIEALLMTREDGDITNSNFNALGDFDDGFGWRVTLGQRPDMTQGREISYFGTSGIEATRTVTDDRLRLNSLFAPGGGLVSSDLSAFSGAQTHTQFKDSTIQSIESNRVSWGWDVLKSFVGWRYIYFADDYQLTSTGPRRDPFNNPIAGTSETGRFRIDTNNHLIGGHIGAELFYDIGYRFSLSGVSKFGAFANLNKVDFFLENDGFEIIDSEDNGATLSTSYEVQLMAHYQIRQTARLRFGYNAFFLSDVATVSDNFSPFVSPFTGFNATDSDDAFFQGFSFGLEIYR